MIQTVSAENFLPFKRKVEFPVAGLGLVLVRGENRVSSAADSNGVGKSALLSAIAFARYGRTLCGRSADEVVNRFSKGPCVVQAVEVDPLTGAAWSVIRGRRPSRVEVYDSVTGRRMLEDADAKDVDAWIEERTLPWSVFRNAVVFDRFERFAKADPAEQMRMLDAVQGVDFRAALERAKAWRASALDAAASARAAVAAATTSIESWRGQAAELRGIKESFRADVMRRIADQEAEEAEARDAVQSALKKLGSFRSAELRLADELVKVEKLRATDENRVTAAATVGLLSGHLERTRQQITDLVKAGKCPECRRPVNRKAADVAFEGAVEDLEEKLDLAKAMLAKVETDVRKLRAGVDPAAVKALEQEASPAAKRLVTEASARAQERLRFAEAALEGLRSEKWAGAAALRAAEARVAELESELLREGREAERHARFAAIASYWVEGFGDRGVRAMLADSVGGFIASRAAHHLEALAAGEARIGVSVDRPKGAQRERLTVVPEWAWGGVGKRAESAGQDCRSDLALFAAIQDLAEASSPRPFGLKMFDEPDGLDGRGLELFGEWVAQEARSRGTAFLVTHRGELANAVDPDETWTVILEGPGDARLERA